MPCALAAQFQLPSLGRVKQHDSLHPQAAVLGATERKNINARLPCHLGGCAARGRQSIGKARAVKVAGQALGLCQCCKRSYFGGGVDGSRLGHVGQGQHPALHAVHATFAHP